MSSARHFIGSLLVKFLNYEFINSNIKGIFTELKLTIIWKTRIRSKIT